MTKYRTWLSSLYNEFESSRIGSRVTHLTREFRVLIPGQASGKYSMRAWFSLRTVLLGDVRLSFLLRFRYIMRQISDRSLVGTSLTSELNQRAYPLDHWPLGPAREPGPYAVGAIRWSHVALLQGVVIYGSILSIFPRSPIFCLAPSRIPDRCKYHERTQVWSRAAKQNHDPGRAIL
jgi:hypothetical protein